MTDYRIVCTTQEPCGVDAKRAHIVVIGTNTEADPAKDTASEKWELSKVIAELDKTTGDRFHTLGKTSKIRANVEKFVCEKCKKTWIRSTADAVKDNNLDELRFCKWKNN